MPVFRDARHRTPRQAGPRCTFHGPSRWPASIRLVVIHDAEGSNAQGVAAYGASGRAKASWHFTVDDKIAIRCLPDDVVAWAAPGANTDGLQVELCGFASWPRRTWYSHQATLKRAAWVVAEWCVLYGIPARWLTDSQVGDGRTEGLTTHVQVNRAFRGSDHTDPGPGFPARYFLWLVRRRLRWLREEGK